MSVQATNNNASIDWSTLLSKLDTATKAAGAAAAGGVSAGQNVTITTRTDGVERTVTFPVPDDLPLPSTVDQAAIDALCAKLAGDSSLGLSEEDVKAVHELLSQTLAAAAPGISPKGSKTVMFDLYQLMALLVEVGQKQRDATREMRSAQNQQIQTSIQNQASEQRTAALAGMIGSFICCAVQVGFSIHALKNQTSAFKEQLGTLDATGVTSAKENLSMLKAADTARHATAQLDKVTAEVGHKPAAHGRTIAQEVVEHGFEKTEQTFAKYETSRVTKTAETARLTRVQNGQAQPGDVPADSDLARAQTRLATFDARQARINELEAKPVRNQAETRELLELSQGFDPAQRPQLVQEVDAGRAKLVGEIQTKIGSAEADMAKYKGEFGDAVKSDLQRYQDEYDAALRDANGITKDTPAADATKIKNNLQLASDKLKLARANAYSKLAQPQFADAGVRAADIKAAGLEVDKAEQARTNDLGYIEATRTLQAGEAKMGMINAIGNASQNFVQGLSSYLQAKTKESEAAQNRKQEELDQTKDLFNQAQSLVDAVIQLMQAVSQAETQSMRDAIQA